MQSKCLPEAQRTSAAEGIIHFLDKVQEELDILTNTIDRKLGLIMMESACNTDCKEEILPDYPPYFMEVYSRIRSINASVNGIHNYIDKIDF